MKSVKTKLDANTQVWEVAFTKSGQREFIKALDTLGALNIWKEEPSTMDVMVRGAQATQVSRLLHEKEIPYSVAMPDVNHLYKLEQSLNATKSLETCGILKSMPPYLVEPKMDWLKYHRLDTIYTFMNELAENYPDICTVHCIGKTVEGRAIKMLKISYGGKCNQGVWIDGGIHGREWISVAVATYIANQLVCNFKSYPCYVTDKDWYILPVANPDGYEYTHTTDRMWRKNRAKYGDCVGVDLNRNWSCGFGENGEDGSSDDPGSIFFRGPAAFSELETIAIKNVIEKSGTEFKVFISLHSYGEAIIFPWGYTGDPCPDYVKLIEGGTTVAKGIFDLSHHTYRVGSTKDLMYYASGTSIDWSYGIANVPFSYMIELRGKKDRFLLPCDCILTTASEVFNGILYLFEFICVSERETPTPNDACACGHGI